MQFAFASLCVHFAFFAVIRFYRKEREGSAKVRQGMPSQFRTASVLIGTHVEANLFFAGAGVPES